MEVFLFLWNKFILREFFVPFVTSQSADLQTHVPREVIDQHSYFVSSSRRPQRILVTPGSLPKLSQAVLHVTQEELSFQTEPCGRRGLAGPMCSVVVKQCMLQFCNAASMHGNIYHLTNLLLKICLFEDFFFSNSTCCTFFNHAWEWTSHSSRSCKNKS